MQFVPPGLTHNYPIAEYIWNLIWSEIWKSYRYVVVQFSPWLFTALFRRMMAEKSTKMFITDILQSHFTTEISTDHIFLHSFQLKFHLSICKYHLILPTPKFRSLRKCFFFGAKSSNDEASNALCPSPLSQTCRLLTGVRLSPLVIVLQQNRQPCWLQTRNKLLIWFLCLITAFTS